MDFAGECCQRTSRNQEPLCPHLVRRLRHWDSRCFHLLHSQSIFHSQEDWDSKGLQPRSPPAVGLLPEACLHEKLRNVADPRKHVQEAFQTHPNRTIQRLSQNVKGPWKYYHERKYYHGKDTTASIFSFLIHLHRQLGYGTAMHLTITIIIIIVVIILIVSIGINPTVVAATLGLHPNACTICKRRRSSCSCLGCVLASSWC